VLVALVVVGVGVIGAYNLTAPQPKHLGEQVALDVAISNDRPAGQPTVAGSPVDGDWLTYTDVSGAWRVDVPAEVLPSVSVNESVWPGEPPVEVVVEEAATLRDSYTITRIPIPAGSAVDLVAGALAAADELPLRLMAMTDEELSSAVPFVEEHAVGSVQTVRFSNSVGKEGEQVMIEGLVFVQGDEFVQLASLVTGEDRLADALRFVESFRSVD